ncbi:MAG: AbrB/MazE/SpoVT family DNA-binding domain-containing protein [Alphaproteobacteria bacterium]|nr:AbrB/MazE/SpoVT family DNA-binding domain-containing protein [Alphaproteobacteria bacterium]
MTKKLPPGAEDAAHAGFATDAPAKAKSTPSKSTLKVRKIGNSLGVVLPKAVLAKLGVGEGDALLVSDIPDGVALSAHDDAVARQVEIGRDLMKRYRNALRELAK